MDDVHGGRAPGVCGTPGGEHEVGEAGGGFGGGVG